MLELLIYILFIGSFLMNKQEREVFGIIVIVIAAILYIGSLFY